MTKNFFPKVPDRESRPLALYHTFVYRLRILFIVLAASLLLIAFLTPFWLHRSPQSSPMPRSHKSETRNLTYQTLHNGRPYVLSAQKAQDLENGLLLFQEIRGKITTDRGITRIQADQGIFDQKKKLLNSQGHVKLSTADGYVLQTDQIQVNSSHNTILGQTPIKGRGPLGTMKGNRFELKNGGHELILKGPSELTLNFQRQKN